MRFFLKRSGHVGGVFSERLRKGLGSMQGTWGLRKFVAIAAILSLSTFILSTAAAASSLWDSNAVPSIDADSDASAVELGVKFQSSVDGVVTALRFYKSSTNTGTHVGNLWAVNGTNLATVTFTNETASGWQEATLSTPVPVTANTIYVVSYHTNVGHYSANSAYFNSAYDNPPLHAPSTGDSGGNGVYHYGATSAFPDQTYNATNYWVDVVLSLRAAGGRPGAGRMVRRRRACAQELRRSPDRFADHVRQHGRSKPVRNVLVGGHGQR